MQPESSSPKAVARKPLPAKRVRSSGYLSWVYSSFVTVVSRQDFQPRCHGHDIRAGSSASSGTVHKASMSSTNVPCANSVNTPRRCAYGSISLPFVFAVPVKADMSFAKPFGYQTSLLILSTGGFRFADFLRARVPLILILWLGFSIKLPLWYGL